MKLAKNSAFTTKSNGLVNVLQNEVSVFEVADYPPDILPKFIAVWDTGATNTVITSNLVNRLSLKPTGRTITRGVHGAEEVNTYMVNILLPNNIIVSEVRVSQGNLGDHVDVLVGMDIIGLGDFSVSNHNGKTSFSFRFPSCQDACFIEASIKSHLNRQDRRNLHKGNNKERKNGNALRK